MKMVFESRDLIRDDVADDLSTEDNSRRNNGGGASPGDSPSPSETNGNDEATLTTAPDDNQGN